MKLKGIALHEAVLDEDAEARLEPVANHREQAEVHHEVAPEGELAPGGDVRAGRGREVERLGEDAPGLLAYVLLSLVSLGLYSYW